MDRVCRVSMATPKAKRKLKTKLSERDGMICGICKREVDLEDVTLDHVMPRAKGGDTTLENLQLAHRACNQEKRDNII